MTIKWTSKALSDLVSLYEFLAVKDKLAAARTVQLLSAVPDRLVDQARIGEKLEEFDPREVRRIVAGRYEMRYEIQESVISVLRIWHTREDR
ncbi:MAG: type II toxin-antitoxin system RelE/ParE family toxin [Geobacter sp.]|jgi:plasmid stabilization system protein ParE|nr:type II toxin-antitoxin system RelE/ParE family toxin [Geobacter sp.]